MAIRALVRGLCTVTVIGSTLTMAGAPLGAVAAVPTPVHAAAVPAAAWPRFHNDPGLSGFNPAPTAITPATAAGLHLLWHRRIGAVAVSSPVVDSGTVYIGSVDGVLHAMDARTGAPRWTFATGSYVETTPTVDSGVVYVGAGNGELSALDADTGALKWQRRLNGRAGSPTVVGATLYVGCLGHRLYALDKDSGAVRWVRHAGGRVWGTPAIGGGLVVIETYSLVNVRAFVQAYDAVTGERRWRTPMAGSTGSPTVVGSRVYFFDFYGNETALDLSTGSQLWDTRIAGESEGSSPAAAYGKTFTSSYDLHLTALASDSGKIQWQVQLIAPDGSGGSSDSSPAVSGGVVFVGGGGGMFGFDATSGARVWYAPTTLYHVVSSSPAVVNDTVYAADEAGGIYAWGF